MRVPPDQSGTARATAASASSSLRAPQLQRDARQPGREQKRLDAPVAAHERVREVQQHARVALHRSADIAQQTRADAGRVRRRGAAA